MNLLKICSDPPGKQRTIYRPIFLHDYGVRQRVTDENSNSGEAGYTLISAFNTLPIRFEPYSIVLLQPGPGWKSNTFPIWRDVGALTN